MRLAARNDPFGAAYAVLVVGFSVLSILAYVNVQPLLIIASVRFIVYTLRIVLTTLGLLLLVLSYTAWRRMRHVRDSAFSPALPMLFVAYMVIGVIAYLPLYYLQPPQSHTSVAHGLVIAVMVTLLLTLLSSSITLWRRTALSRRSARQCWTSIGVTTVLTTIISAMGAMALVMSGSSFWGSSSVTIGIVLAYAAAVWFSIRMLAKLG